MHEYDVALKRVIMRPCSALLTQLTGAPALNWLNVETPIVRNLRVDLFGQRPAGDLVQIEFQSRNERNFALRMAAYRFSLGLLHNQVPRQIVLYVGDEPMNLESQLQGPEYDVRFCLIDARDLDGESLLASADLGDNIVSILTRRGERPDTLREILERIKNGPSENREEALAEFAVIAGLRKLSAEVRKEATKMPIHYDIRDNEEFGPMFREEYAKGQATGQIKILLRLIEKRFGKVTTATRERIAGLQPGQLEEVSLRILDAKQLEDIFTA
jgi:hypothetical protein